MARLISHAGEFFQRFDDVTRKVVTECAIVYAEEVKRRFTESPRSGRLYSRGTRGRRKGKGRVTTYHRASAPGESPAVDTGALRASVTYDVQATPHGIEARVGTPLKTGKWLEFGTKRMAARPAWRPALNSARPKFEGIARKHRDGGGGPAPAAAAVGS